MWMLSAISCKLCELEIMKVLVDNVTMDHAIVAVGGCIQINDS